MAQHDFTSNFQGSAPGNIEAELPIVIVDNKVGTNSYGITATGEYAWAEGYETVASGAVSHAEGSSSEATASCAHAEGNASKATSSYAHAEGSGTESSGSAAHAEGYGTIANGSYAHAEGFETTASGFHSHAEGFKTHAFMHNTHAGGMESEAIGDTSFVHGTGVKMESVAGAGFGKYNSDVNARFVIGSGTADNNRSDAFKVDANGDTWIMISGVLTNISSLLA